MVATDHTPFRAALRFVAMFFQRLFHDRIFAHSGKTIWKKNIAIIFYCWTGRPAVQLSLGPRRRRFFHSHLWNNGIFADLYVLLSKGISLALLCFIHRRNMRGYCTVLYQRWSRPWTFNWRSVRRFADNWQKNTLH